MEMKIEMETITTLIDTLVEFAVAYGFQILGALFFLFIGLKAATWAGAKLARVAVDRNIDQTLARFIGNFLKLVIVGFVVIITLGNFGISIAPLIALAGATAFGATLAIQGPLSNYGAGVSIILTRPFVIGDTITVDNVSGIVESISLANTVLVGEDGEQITVPNKELVGQVIVNSQGKRVVETQIAIGIEQDCEQAIDVLRGTFAAFPDIDFDPAPQVGIHDFTYGGVILCARFWVPSAQYFQTRYAINAGFLKALRSAGISPLTPAGLAVAAAPAPRSTEV
jgi:small conductance mechanosensitive channel